MSEEKAPEANEVEETRESERTERTAQREARRADQRDRQRQRSLERTERREAHRAERTNRRRRRSLFWPIIFVGVGVLWLLSNLGVLDEQNLAVVLKLWPLIFVVIGLELLLGRSSPLVGGLIGLLAIGLVIALAIVGPALGLAAGEPPSFLGLPLVPGTIEVQHGRFTEPLDGAESADVILDLNVGRTTVEALSGSDDLLVADLDYIGRIELESSGGARRDVRLREVEPPATLGGIREIGTLEWDIGLTPDIPMDLDVDMGAGPTNLDLSELQLTDVTIDGGAGALQVALPAGDAYEASIDAGVGPVDINLPDGAQVALDFDSGAGSIDVEIGEAASVTFSYDGGAGPLDVEIGEETSFEAELSNGAGSVSIDVPDDAPVRVEIREDGPGSVNLPGEYDLVDDRNGDSRKTGVWESPNYDGADNPITIVVTDMGVGSFTVN